MQLTETATATPNTTQLPRALQPAAQKPNVFSLSVHASLKEAFTASGEGSFDAFMSLLSTSKEALADSAMESVIEDELAAAGYVKTLKSFILNRNRATAQDTLVSCNKR